MAKERERFLAGVATQETATPKLAAEIFDQMETFAAYGFNKSHSAAYAVITYQTAYLKAHYPTEFMAGLLSLEAGDADSTYKNIAECKASGIAILPPDVNQSREDFTAAGRAIRFGLGAVKGVGSKAIETDPCRPCRRRVHRPARVLPAGAGAAGEPARDREPDRLRRVRLDRAQPRPAVGRARRRAPLGRGALAGALQLAARPLRRRRRAARHAAARAAGRRAVDAARRARARARDAGVLHHRPPPRSLRGRPAPVHQHHGGHAAHEGPRAARGALTGRGVPRGDRASAWAA